MGQEELAKWLTEQCEDRNLAWSEASRRAGVSPNTISEIVNGTRVGVKRLLPLADFFGVPHEFILRLSGHLPPRSDPSGLPPQTVELIREMNELLLRQPEPEQRRIMTAVLMLLRGAEVTVTPLDEP